MQPVYVRFDKDTIADMDNIVEAGDFDSRSDFIAAAVNLALDYVEEHGDEAFDELHDKVEDDEDEDDGNDNPGSDEEE